MSEPTTRAGCCPTCGQRVPDRELGKRIRALRERFGVSLTEMACRTGKNLSSLSSIETGKRRGSDLEAIYLRVCREVMAERQAALAELEGAGHD